MKLIYNREKLARSFGMVATVAPKTGHKPALQNVLIDGATNTLTATNLEQSISIHVVPIESIGDHKLLVPAGRMSAILREATSENVVLIEDTKTVKITCGGSKYSLPLQDASEFPVMRHPESIATHTIQQVALKYMLDRTDFCCDDESSRYALSGVCFEMSDKITAIGTDGRRMAVVESLASDKASGEATSIVPRAATRLISRSCDNGEATITCDANALMCQLGDVIIITRLVEGKFPAWQDVIPQGNDHTVDLTAGPAHAALRQAAIACGDDSRGVTCELNGMLVLSARTADVGESRVELPCDWQSEPITISLDNRYVGDFLRCLKPDGSFGCR